MSSHPLAFGLALQLQCQLYTDRATTEPLIRTAVSIVLERYLPKWQDDHVADLYARVVESLLAANPLLLSHSLLAHICSRALIATDEFREATSA